MSNAPEGYEVRDAGMAYESYYRPIEGTAEAVIAALSVLPPDTSVATMSSEWDGGVNEDPSGAWYYPQHKQVQIG